MKYRCLLLLSCLTLAACGGGGGGGGGGDGGGSGLPNGGGSGGADSGYGQPFDKLLIGTHTGGYRFADHEIGHYRGRPPAPASGSSDNPYRPATLSADLFYTSTNNSAFSRPIEAGSLSAGEHYNSLYVVAPSWGTTADHNLLAQAYSKSTPTARLRLVVHRTSGGNTDALPEPQNIVCEVSGPAEGLFCLADTRAETTSAYLVTVQAIDDAADVFVQHEADVSDQLRAAFEQSPMFVVPEDYRDQQLSNLELKPFPANAQFSSDFTVFLYFPDVDKTVFFPVEVEQTGATGYVLPVSLSRANGVSVEEGYRLAQGLSRVETQIFYGTPALDEVLAGDWPGKDVASRWSEVRTAEIMPRAPSQPGGGGGGGGGGDTDGLGGPRAQFTFTCATPGSQPRTVEVTSGVCKRQQERYSEVYACNEIRHFSSSCNELYSCAVNNSSGVYRDYYQRFLSGCY